MSIWDVGFAYLLKGEKDPITLKANQLPARGLHFVDETGATIVPLYVADAVPLPGQAPTGGFKITIPGATAIAGLQTQINNLSAIEAPFVMSYTTDPLVIDWSATEGKRHVKITVGADALNIAASTNAIEGYSYRLTLIGGPGTYGIDDTAWVIGYPFNTIIGFSYPPMSGDVTERYVFEFVFTSGKMRLMAIHKSDDA